MNTYEKLINKLNDINGISLRMAEKIALSLVNNELVIDIFKDVITLSTKLEYCPRCNLIKEKKELCDNCSSNSNILTIINGINDYFSLNSKIEENLVFFSLNFKSKTSYSNIDEINRKINQIIFLLREKKLNEILFLLSPSLESELIIKIIKHEIHKSNFQNLKLSRLNIGVPFGALLEYSDERTLKEAIRKREKV